MEWLRQPAKPATMPLDRRGPATPHAHVADVAAALADWTRGSGPMLARLATALESAILRGTIPAGTRLPSERELAQRLGISRSTVVAAYDRLKVEGRAHTQRGSGTYAGPPGPLTRGGRFTPGHLVSIVDNRDGPRQTVEFTIAALPGSREIAPAGERLAKQLERLSRETPGYLPLGLPVLRREIARGYAQRGLPTEPEQIIVTSGAQQAIALVAQLFRGDRVAMEDPTNPASLDAFRAAGAESWRWASTPTAPTWSSSNVCRRLACRPRCTWPRPTTTRPEPCCPPRAAAVWPNSPPAKAGRSWRTRPCATSRCTTSSRRRRSPRSAARRRCCRSARRASCFGADCASAGCAARCTRSAGSHR